MKKMIKKCNSKLILLFLFTFFSIGVQGQYDENGLRGWRATEVGQIIAKALTTSDSWQSTQSFFVRDQQGNFVRIDFGLEEVVVTSSSGSINFDYTDDEENLFYEFVNLTELTPEELAEATATVQEIPNCPKWYVWDGVQCVRISEAERRPCEKAIISDHVYDTKDGALKVGADPLPRNTKLISQTSLPSDLVNVKLTDTVTGFNSALYKVDNGNGDIEYIYATAGSDELKDFVDNGQQALGLRSEQYVQSVSNARLLKIWADKNHIKLSFTGHSLGGGMANANALATGLPATIYNPAGLNDGTITNLNLNITNSKYVTAYVVQGEVVDKTNLIMDNPVRGNTKYIGSALVPLVAYGASALLGLGTTPLGSRAIDFAIGAALHTMLVVKSNLDCN